MPGTKVTFGRTTPRGMNARMDHDPRCSTGSTAARRPPWPDGHRPGCVVSTAAELLRRRADDDGPGLCIGDGQWSFRQVVEEGSRRAALFDALRDDDRPPHVGVLLDNVPDYLFWLAAAALGGFVIVGVNSTYRGDQLGLLDPPQRLPAARHRRRLARALRRRRHRRRRRPRAPRRRRRLHGARRRAADGAPRVRGRRRRPLPAHLHVGLDRAAEGGAVHPGSLRPHRRARGEGRRARRPATPSTRRCRSSTRARCSPGGRRR